MDTTQTVNTPEFPCDVDLEPFVLAGELDAWQAMAITSCRAASETRILLAELQKKMEQLLAQPAPNPFQPKPVFRSLGSRLRS